MQLPTPFARIGTRGSPLALAQAQLVRDRLAARHGVAPDSIAITVISTHGDRSQAENTTLSTIGGKGVFTKEIDEALLGGHIDIGVHSSKDVATGLSPGMALAAFLEREDVRDAFISVSVKGIDNLPQGARLGTSSIRRAAQARRLRPDLTIVPFRGNVHTRLQKLLDGVADALGDLRAEAWIERTTRSLVFAHARLTGPDGAVLVTCSAVLRNATEA